MTASDVMNWFPPLTDTTSEEDVSREEGVRSGEGRAVEEEDEVVNRVSRRPHHAEPQLSKLKTVSVIGHTEDRGGLWSRSVESSRGLWSLSVESSGGLWSHCVESSRGLWSLSVESS